MSERKSWIVRVKCSVTKDVVTSDCTKEEAEDDPFEHAISEVEVGQDGYEVMSVEPNE